MAILKISKSQIIPLTYGEPVAGAVNEAVAGAVLGSIHVSSCSFPATTTLRRTLNPSEAAARVLPNVCRAPFYMILVYLKKSLVEVLLICFTFLGSFVGLLVVQRGVFFCYFTFENKLLTLTKLIQTYPNRVVFHHLSSKN